MTDNINDDNIRISNIKVCKNFLSGCYHNLITLLHKLKEIRRRINEGLKIKEIQPFFTYCNKKIYFNIKIYSFIKQALEFKLEYGIVINNTPQTKIKSNTESIKPRDLYCFKTDEIPINFDLSKRIGSFGIVAYSEDGKSTRYVNPYMNMELHILLSYSLGQSKDLITTSYKFKLKIDFYHDIEEEKDVVNIIKVWPVSRED